MRTWNDLFTDPRFHWTEPDPGVVESAARWLAEGRRLVHDLGCGAGRHLAYLSSLGFEVVGGDVSPNGLAVAARELREAGLPCRLVQADMSAAPFRDGVFDAAISTNVLNHGIRAALQQAVDEVYRTLRPGGEFYLTVIGPGDWRYGTGEEVEPDSFILADGPEAGILHHFFSEPDLRAWLAAFEIIRLDHQRGELKLSTAPDGPPVIRDGWAVWATKP